MVYVGINLSSTLKEAMIQYDELMQATPMPSTNLVGYITN
jgi:hypothetical protein